jgi:hypothetical protein
MSCRNDPGRSKNKLSLYFDSGVLLLLFGQRGDDELTCLFARMRWQVPTV